MDGGFECGLVDWAPITAVREPCGVNQTIGPLGRDDVGDIHLVLVEIRKDGVGGRIDPGDIATLGEGHPLDEVPVQLRPTCLEQPLL